MNKNITILDNWNKEISIYDRLDLKSAKELYIEIKNETNEKTKLRKRNKLIEGTLYVIYEHIKNKLYFLYSSKYDMDDIINICNEIWTIMIDNGKLENINYFSNMFDNKFYSLLTEKLVNNKYSIGENIICNVDNITKLLSIFTEYMEKNNFNYEEFISLISKKTNINMHMYNTFNMIETLNLLNYLYEYLEKNYAENKKISKNYLNMIKYILLNDYPEVPLQEYQIEDFSNPVINNIYYQKILDIILKMNLSDRELDILKRRFGIFESKIQCYQELAKEYNVSIHRIRDIEAKTIRKIRRNNTFREYIKEE